MFSLGFAPTLYLDPVQAVWKICTTVFATRETSFEFSVGRINVYCGDLPSQDIHWVICHTRRDTAYKFCTWVGSYTRLTGPTQEMSRVIHAKKVGYRSLVLCLGMCEQSVFKEQRQGNSF